MSRRAVAAVVVAVVGGCGSGGSKDRLTVTLPRGPASLHVISPAFTQNSRLPSRYTCDGAGDEPVVRAGTVPPSTRELVLVVTDPDAPGGTFVHVTRYGLSRFGDGTVSSGGVEGTNSAGDRGWTPPCPPKGDGAHRYIWSVYALRQPSGLDAGASVADVAHALDEPVLASGSLTARYSR